MLRWLAALVIPALASSQDPYASLPRNYHLELENEFVRISRVTYFPGNSLPVHSHPALPTAYIYLTDGGPVRFTHKTPAFTIERPAVKAGTVRFNRNAQLETHEVRYLGNAPAEYLRVELKTTPGPRHRDARLRTLADFPWEDSQLRITNVEGAVTHLSHPAVIVNIPTRRFTWCNTPDPPPAFSGSSIVLELK